MYKIAITGGIGSGKSTAVKMLKARLNENVLFYSVDEIVHDLYGDIHFQDHLVKQFGTCDRKALSNWAFNVPPFRKLLEREFKEAIRHKLDDHILQEDSDIPAVIVEFPLLFEASWQDKFDLTILVTADLEVRQQRAMARDSITKEKFDQIVAAQLDEDSKIDLADLVIYNNYDKPEWLDETIGDYVNTEQILKELKKCHLALV